MRMSSGPLVKKLRQAVLSFTARPNKPAIGACTLCLFLLYSVLIPLSC